MTGSYAAAEGLVRVYPAPRPHGAALVWMHGGAFVRGDLDMPEAHRVASVLAANGTTVVSVDYRLARAGCRYPAPSNDVMRAWFWTLEHADEVAIDPSRVAIGGATASAGGNLAAGATLRLLCAREATPALVMLAYPTLLAVQPAPDPELRAALDADPAADRYRRVC